MAESEKTPPSYEQAYQKLRVAYLKRLENSLEAIQNVLTQRQLGKLTRDDLLRAQHLAHGLAGSGTTFGFPDVTEAGRKADTFLTKALRAMPDDSKAMDDESFGELEKLMMDLHKACDSAVHAKVDQASPVVFADRPGSSQKTFHVLVVDDDREIGKLLFMKLQQRGIRVTVARDGSTALQVAAKTPPDLVILDISMPGMNGHEVLRRLRQDPESVAIPILMLTGKAEQVDVVSALHSGAMDYILKPFDPDVLLARIEKILDAARFTVLIADNDPLILHLLDCKFRRAGFKVILADDGQKAWERIWTAHPDLVILDRMMPGMGGLEVLKNMRGETSVKSIPVIMLSARKEKRDIEAGLKMGAQDYVAKPFIPDELVSRSLKILKK